MERLEESRWNDLNSCEDEIAEESNAGSRKKTKNQMNSVLKELFSTAVYILIVLALTKLIVTYVGQRTVVDGKSMESTLHHGDNLWVNKFGYNFLSDPERFDIVVFPSPVEDGEYYIKRIIGMPGEEVRIDDDGNIYINGSQLIEHYGLDTIDANHIGRASEPVLLGDDEYFVMGDNRNNSIDSRFDIVGNIKREEIMGKAVCRLFPFNSICLF